MVSRSALIAQLKAKKVKGSLSKMNKSKLLELHRELEKSVLDGDSSLQIMAGAAPSTLPQTGGGIALAPEGDRRGGAHVPAPKPKKKLGPYREFVREHLKNHGGDMAAVARERERE